MLVAVIITAIIVIMVVAPILWGALTKPIVPKESKKKEDWRANVDMSEINVTKKDKD